MKKFLLGVAVLSIFAIAVEDANAVGCRFGRNNVSVNVGGFGGFQTFSNVGFAPVGFVPVNTFSPFAFSSFNTGFVPNVNVQTVNRFGLFGGRRAITNVNVSPFGVNVVNRRCGPFFCR